MAGTLDIQEDVPGWSLGPPLFDRYVVENGLTYMQVVSWATAAQAIPEEPFDSIRLSYRESTNWRLFSFLGPAALHISLEGGQVYAVVAAPSAETADLALDQLRDIIPVAPPGGDEKRIPLWLWTMTQHGPQKIRRMIDVPSWEDVETNYTSDVQGPLATLMAERPSAGKIILWSGVPGTGKSYALRALAYEWRAWCDLHYVVDPETLFGERADYLIQLLLDGDVSDGPSEPKAGVLPPEERWRLLVLEDTGEMMTVDAKQHVGQALSRLLNVTDGLIGQGMRLLVLVTTNEDIGKLHPAIARPGRCAARIEFSALTAIESEAWLRERGIEQAVGASPIADLFGIIEGHVEPPMTRTVGFRQRSG